MCACAGPGSRRELATRAEPCGKGIRGIGNRPAKARWFGRHTGARAEGVGQERDVVTLQGCGGPDRQGHCVDWVPKAAGSLGQERLSKGPGFGECHSNCMGERRWGRGTVGAVGEAVGS